MRSILFRPFRVITYRELAYLVFGLPLSILAFAVFVTGVSAGIVLLPVVIGLPILIGTAYLHRGIAWAERQRAALVLGAAIEQSYRRPTRPGIVAIVRTLGTDPQTWKDAGWMILVSIIGFCGSIVALVLWPVTLWALSFPFYGWALSGDQITIELGDGSANDWADDQWNHHPVWVSVMVGAVGFLLLHVTTWVCAAFAHGQVRLAQLLLSPGAGERRVSELTRTRAASVDAQTSELRRIERDLHDGAQARMVAVTLDLGLAKEKLDSDPAAARELIEAAHTEATTAIAELRHLVAGIAPAVLTDRGLDAALSSLVATCRVPVSVDVNLPTRMPMAVETAAYFVVAEALTNVQKHARATHATIHGRVQEGRLVLEIGDNGTGGADPDGSGLTGLRDRVAALDGTLTLSSPAGGPTVLRVDVPCAS